VVTFSFDDIQQMADERSDIRPWGSEEYRRDEYGEWYLDHLVVRQPGIVTIVWMDGTPSSTYTPGGGNV
jgi:hypothetical protein